MPRKSPAKEWILKQLQANPSLRSDTSSGKIAEKLNKMGCPYSMTSVQLLIGKMVREQILHRDGTRYRATWTLNYLHPQMPQSVIDCMPEELKADREKILNNLGPNDYINQFGCVVKAKGSTTDETTPASDDPFSEEFREQDAQTNAPEDETTSTDELVPAETVTPEVVVERQPNGGVSISLTINLNLK